MGSVAGNIVINPAGALSVNRSDSVTYTSKLSGTGTLLKTGTGTLTMSGANSFSGNVTVNSGTLNYSGNSTLPAGNYTVTAGTLNIGALSNSIGAFQITGGTISGSGTLTSNAAYDVQAGTVNAKLAGTSIALNKTGSGTAVLSGANVYTGLTTLTTGTLELGPAAQNAVFNLGGANVKGGKLVFDYNGATSPAATIESLLTASCDGGHWDVGQFRDSTALASGLTLGWFDNPATHTVTLMPTYAGDFNLDGVVNDLDLNIWSRKPARHKMADGRRQL